MTASSDQDPSPHPLSDSFCGRLSAAACRRLGATFRSVTCGPGKTLRSAFSLAVRCLIQAGHIARYAGRLSLGWFTAGRRVIHPAFGLRILSCAFRSLVRRMLPSPRQHLTLGDIFRTAPSQRASSDRTRYIVRSSILCRESGHLGAKARGRIQLYREIKLCRRRGQSNPSFTKYSDDQFIVRPLPRSGQKGRYGDQRDHRRHRREAADPARRTP